MGVALAACGGPSNVAVTNDITIKIIGPSDDLPFDPRGARLQSATSQLSHIAGHPIQLQIDAAVASDMRADFEHQLIDAVETLARVLTSFEESEADDAPRTFGLLQRVEVRYVATIDDRDGSDAKFDSAAGVVRIEASAHPRTLVPMHTTLDALLREDDVYRGSVWGNKTPDTISPSERQAFFDFHTRPRRGGETGYSLFVDAAAGPRAKNQHEWLLRETVAHARSIQYVVRLDELNRAVDPDLQSKIHTWLLEQAPGFFSRAYRNRADYHASGSLEQTAGFRAAETAYSGWLNQTIAKATPAELGRLHRSLFEEQPSDAYPAVDRFAFGLLVIDLWLRSGKQQSELTNDLVCPTGPAAANGKHDRNTSCFSAQRGWLAYVSMDPGRLKRLAAALDERNDPDLATAVFFSIRGARSRFDTREEEGPENPFVDLFHQLDVHRKSWRAALDVVAYDQKARREAEAKYIWKTALDRRGDAVFLLSKADVNYTGSNNEGLVWKTFARSYGAPIDASMLSQMLEHGPLAFVEVPQVWPALAPGFSRADVLLPRLDAFLPDASLPAAAPLVRTLSAIVTRLCTDHNASDLGKVHAWVQRREQARPAERAALTILDRDTAPGGCTARATSRSP